MSRMVRSSVGPALSRMRGECTRPSVPMMKLTRTFELGSAMSSSGFGVARGSGGSEASQLAPAVCNIAANSESCSAQAHTWRSRAANESDEAGHGKDRVGEAMQAVDAKATRSNEHHLRTGMSNSLGAGGDERSRHTASYPGAIRLPAHLLRMYLRKPNLNVSEC